MQNPLTWVHKGVWCVAGAYQGAFGIVKRVEDEVEGFMVTAVLYPLGSKQGVELRAPSSHFENPNQRLAPKHAQPTGTGYVPLFRRGA